MNCLFFTHAAPQFLPPVILDHDEIICGPQYNNWRQNGVKWKYMNTSSGFFDVMPSISKLSAVQYPEYIFVHADATLGCLPHNFPENVKKVLLVGDTHHLQGPIQNIISYAAQIKFDAIILWNRQHAHFFTEFGFDNVFWMPGLSFAIPEIPRVDEKLNQLSFFGQIGLYHPRRGRLIKALQQQGVPLVGGKLPRMDSLRLTAENSLSLNITLNGEWNLRVFESTSCGALLITDKLSQQTGLELFYPEGDSMICYHNIDELLGHIQYFSKNPELSRTIASQAQKQTRDYFSLEARKDAIFALLNDDVTLDVYRLDGEPRCSLPQVSKDDEAWFVLRLKTYEWLQEQHRLSESLEVALSNSVSVYFVSDMADLIRLKQSLYIEEQLFDEEWLPLLKELGVNNSFRKDFHDWGDDVVELFLTTIADLDLLEVQEVIRGKKAKSILITDFYLSQDSRIERAMLEFGFRSNYGVAEGMFSLPD